MSRANVCRLALAVDDEPYLVTMSYGLVADNGYTLYLHSAGAGKKTDMIRRNPRVCFTIDGRHHVEPGDEPCRWTVRYESIVGYGTIRIITDETERRVGLDAIMRQHGAEPPFNYANAALDQAVVLCLEVDELTGKSNLPAGDPSDGVAG
jgi:nitroimidazol reductase NimA-like FMN-containing flavoprotein (pyridoxamine 5'-phosphate oxidase superfamily)